MSTSVAIEELNLVVCGQVQYAFSVGEEGGLTLMDMLTNCSAARAVAVDGEVQSLSAALRKRTATVNDLGNALSLCAAIVAAMPKEQGTSKFYPKDLEDNTTGDASKIEALYSAVVQYGLSYKKYVYDDKGNRKTEPETCSVSDTLWTAAYGKNAPSLSYYDAQLIQSAIKLKLDQENNGLKGTSNALQNFLSKRDDAYSLINKLCNKLNKTTSTVVGAIGN